MSLIYYALERASLTYADTGSSYARERALELIAEFHDCLDGVQELILSVEDDTPHTSELEVQA